jgi:general secretion pathway protein C
MRAAPPVSDLGPKDYHQAHAFLPMNAASWLEALPPQERWRPLLLSEGPRIATWVLGLALGVQAAFIVTDMAGTGRKPAGPGAAPIARAQPLNVAAITGAHLFGSAPVAAQDGREAGPSNIALVLTGTIAGNDPQNGLAILGPTPQAVKVYAVGDNLPGNVKLHSVYTDRVVIDRDGQLESIALPHQANPGNAPPPSAAAFQPENPAMERMRRMITEQPNLIGDVIRASPVTDHGHMNGFRIYPGRDRAAFTRLGLHPADQVIAVNGTPLDDRDRSEQILKTLSASSEAHVTLIRNGQQQELTLNIAQLAQEAEGIAAQSQPANTTSGAAANAAAAASAANAATPAAADSAQPPPPVPEQPPGDSAGQ